MTQSSFGSLILCLGGGLLLGSLCLAAGLVVVGMGHGWEIPFQYGLLSLLLYPLAVMRCWWIEPRMPCRRDMATTAAVALTIIAALTLAGMLPFVLNGWLIFLVGASFYWFAGRALERSGRHAAVGDAGLLAIGIALSFSALADHATSAYAARSWLTQLYWLPLWLGWQVIAAAALARHLRRS